MNGYIRLQVTLLALCCYVPYCDASVLGESCDTTNNDCTGLGLVCGTSDTCYCGRGYGGAGDGCIAFPGYGCQVTSDCRDGAFCSGDVCACSSNYYDNNGVTTLAGQCLSRRSLGSQCQSHATSGVTDQCIDLNAICSGGIPGSCNCITGFFLDDNTNTCEPSKALDESCDPTKTEECSDSNAECLLNPTYKCTCNTGFYKNNSSSNVYNCEEVSHLQVTMIIFSSVTTSSVTVSWSPPAGKSSYVSRYTVTWRPKDNSGSDNSRTVTSTSTTVSTGLTSGQAYRVTITSLNTYTQQGSDRSTSTYKEQAIKPIQSGPLILSESNLDAGNNDILLKWTASKGVVSIYFVEIKDGTTSLTTVSTASAQTTISSTYLKHGYTYTVNIIARSKPYGTNNAQESSTTYTTTIKTVVKAPGPPTNAQCIESTDATFKLKWDATSTPNGDLKEYLIKIYEDSNLALTFSRKLLTGNVNTEYTVENLKSGSYYRFEVFTVNEQFTSTTGLYTPAPHCATKAQSFTVPHSFVIDNIGSRGFTTSWTGPANINTGELFGYVLQIKYGHACVSEQMYKCSGCTGTNIDTLFQNIEQQCGQAVQTTNTKTKAELSGQQTFTTDKLFPYINYTVSVAAVNSEGKGYVGTIYAQTQEEAPNKPFNVGLSFITSTTVVVEWSINGPRPGITTYTIIVEPVDKTAPIVTSTVQGFTNTTYKVTGLEEFWTYTVKAMVATSIGENTSDVTDEFKTLISAPGPVVAFIIQTPFNGEFTHMQISWKIPTILRRNGVIKTLKIVHNATGTSNIELQSEESRTFSSIQEDFIYSIIVDVIPKQTYTFRVYAINTEDMTGEITKETIVAPSAETESAESSNTALIVGAVMGAVVLLLIVALVISIVRNKRLKTKQNEPLSNPSTSNTQENQAFDNLQEVSTPVSGDYANNYMELDDTSRVDTYDRINIGRPNVESSATDTEQYEIVDVPSQK